MENRGGGFAKDLGGLNWPGRAQDGNMEDGQCCRQNEHSKTNGLERLAWPASHTENRGGGFTKDLGG